MGWYIGVFVFYMLFLFWSCIQSLKKVESMSDFTTGGHRMGLMIGIGTSVATWVSVASVMGVPGYLYSSGVAAIIGWVAGWFFGTALIPLVAYKIRRPETPARTFPEFVQQRYEPYKKNSQLRTLVGALMLIGYFIFTHLQVVGFGIVFSTITGIDYKIAIFVFLIFLLFTSVGGFWSVAVTDSVNTVLIVLGVFMGAGAVLAATGGWQPILDTLATTTAPTIEGGESLSAGVLLSPVGTFGLGALFSIFISNSLGAAVSPHWVTRMLAPKSVKVAVMQMMFAVIVLIAIFTPLIIIGLGAKTLIPSMPAGQTTDYIMPMVITQYAHPLVGALTLVALCAAAVSTANSMLLHCGTSLYNDIYKNIFPNRRASEATERKQLRYVIYALGLLAIISAINPPVLLAMGFTYVYGGFGAAFFFVVYLGLYWKRMNHIGAYANIIIGSVVYIIAKVMGATNPFIIALAVSFIGVLIAVYTTKKPALEAYEPYFEADVSPSTKKVIAEIQQTENVHEEYLDTDKKISP
ncbi:sodium:solute symporter family protein [Halalkalibacter okhensis]|uniref:Sodium:solute symporter n=1 Tax=Halalkalibacter okhensis TaxID=333138 RepID=A0A0B0IEW2_9BACI|nr:sodium:solute symporter family protein [Halalkalibacter okhensis]KHF39372.1 sodium:solute symporter [Halalkalibacter okhensis]